MTMHALFPAHPAPTLFPDGTDDLLSRRQFANRMGTRIVDDQDTSLPFHLARVLGDFERRIEARMAQVAK